MAGGEGRRSRHHSYCSHHCCTLYRRVLIGAPFLLRLCARALMAQCGLLSLCPGGASCAEPFPFTCDEDGADASLRGAVREACVAVGTQAGTVAVGC